MSASETLTPVNDLVVGIEGVYKKQRYRENMAHLLRLIPRASSWRPRAGLSVGEEVEEKRG